jgi:hypothetical protein
VDVIKPSGAIDDYLLRWISDFGLPEVNRDERGQYLILPPDHSDPLPEGRFFAAVLNEDPSLE